MRDLVKEAGKVISNFGFTPEPRVSPNGTFTGYDISDLFQLRYSKKSNEFRIASYHDLSKEVRFSAPEFVHHLSQILNVKKQIGKSTFTTAYKADKYMGKDIAIHWEIPAATILHNPVLGIVSNYYHLDNSKGQVLFTATEDVAGSIVDFSQIEGLEKIWYDEMLEWRKQLPFGNIIYSFNRHKSQYGESCVLHARGLPKGTLTYDMDTGALVVDSKGNTTILDVERWAKSALSQDCLKAAPTPTKIIKRLAANRTTLAVEEIKELVAEIDLE